MRVSPLVFNGSFHLPLEYVNIRKGRFLCIWQEKVKRRSRMKEHKGQTSPYHQTLGSSINIIERRFMTFSFGIEKHLGRTEDGPLTL